MGAQAIWAQAFPIKSRKRCRYLLHTCSLSVGMELCTAVNINREDSSLPLLGPNTPPKDAGCVSVELERTVAEARVYLEDQLNTLRSHSGREFGKAETSELLRETCQALSDLGTALDRTWSKANPGSPLPQWPVEIIPEEEFARIGWDFHANRVQIVDTKGSLWGSLSYLVKTDSFFAKPPSPTDVVNALQRVVTRLEEASAYGLEEASGYGLDGDVGEWG